MRIIIVTSSKTASGGTRQALYLARGLKDQGHSVYFAAPEQSTIFRQAQDLSCIALPKGVFAIRKELQRLFADDEPTIIHAFHNRAVKIISFLGTLWRLQKLPVFCVAHRGVTARPQNPLPYLLPGLRAYLVNSKACARMLPLLWRKHRCRVVYNSLPMERLSPSRPAVEVRTALAIPDSHLVLGTVANDNPLKGFDLLIRAYAELRDSLPPSTLVLVGGTPEKWLPLCRKLGVEEHVRILPPTETVPDFIQTFDLFVFASNFIESQPNVIMEAMALGLPIVASNVGGVPELLPDKFLFPPKDINALCDKVLDVLHAPDLLHASAAHSQAMKGVFSLDRRLREVMRAYNDIIREGVRKASDTRSFATESAAFRRHKETSL